MGIWGYCRGVALALALLGAGTARAEEVGVAVGAGFREAVQVVGEAHGGAAPRFSVAGNVAPLIRCRMVENGVERACGGVAGKPGGTGVRNLQLVYL